MKTPTEHIRKHRTDMPLRYRKLYDRCASGQASPREAIKMQCLECWGWVQTETAQCDNYACPLFEYRPYQVPDRTTPAAQNPQTRAGGYHGKV